MLRGRGDLSPLGFRQTLHDVGSAVPRQHLGFLGLLSAIALPDLFGAAFFRGFAIFGRYRIRVDQLLGEGRPAKNQGGNQADAAK
jgi:hypothetical protein